VEDDLVNRRVGAAMLESLGFHVDVVDDGTAAVEAASDRRYQVILMDCQIPGLDGYEATGAIRREAGPSRRTPIIAISASDSPAEQRRCLAAGMDDFLGKPLTRRALTSMLLRWVPGPAPSPVEDGETGGRVPARMGPVGAEDLQPAVLDAVVLDRLVRLGVTLGEDLLAQLTAVFLTDAATRVAAMRRAVAAQDVEEVARSAHTLRGAGANLGATRLVELCAGLEADGAAGRHAGEAWVDDVETELGRVRAALTLALPPS
jgi:CheY-like chemotaxis protein